MKKVGGSGGGERNGGYMIFAPLDLKVVFAFRSIAPQFSGTLEVKCPDHVFAWDLDCSLALDTHKRSAVKQPRRFSIGVELL